MKTFFKDNKKAIILSFYSLICALFWTALRVNYAGISKALGADTNPSFIVMNLPIIFLVIMWLLFSASLFFIYKFSIKEKKKAPFIILLSLNILNTLLNLGIVYGGAYDYLDFILPKFNLSLAISLVIIIISILFLLPFDNKRIGTIHKVVFLVAILIFSVFYGYGYKKNSFTYDAVVYAVEDEYQIVFSTNDNSISWVTINGETYFDLYSGSMKSKDNVHKICVPQAVLDSAKSYTIYAQKLIYRGPFGGYKGKVLEKTYNFKPVDTSDGFNYYAMSDVHGCYKGATNSAKSIDNLDLLLILGDTTSMVEYEENANFTNKVAYEVTKGEIPVIYLRGNHEIKGNYAEDLYKYVGSKDQKFYYTFTLSNVFGIVLDLGEDHDDDWWEYYDTSKFDLYRDEQTEFIKEVISKKEYENYDYVMALSHIPVTFVNSRHNHESYKNEWTSLLNEMNIDIYLSGHQHDLCEFIPNLVTPNETLEYNPNYKGKDGVTYNGYLTNFNFYGFMVARPFSDSQTGKDIKLGKTHYVGLNINVDLENRNQTAKYINSNGEVVPVCNMFYNDEPQEGFTIPLN